MDAEMDYLDDLIADCEKAKKAKPNKTFVLKQPRFFDDLKVLNEINFAIYIIKEIKGDPDKTFSQLKAYKEYSGPDKRACPKINKPSKILYVGSSRKKLKNRIKEHMGWGSAKTYALNLNHWFKHGSFEIEISSYDVEPRILLLLEDVFASQLKPAFGKRGGNSNS